MQMVDRSGSVTEQELAGFCQQVSHFAEEHDAAVSFPQRQQKLVAARELDRFCADVDVLIGINVVPRQAVEGTRLRSFVEAGGLQLEPDGAFHYLADSGNTLYSLMAADQMPFTFHTLLDKSFPALTLLFDVPRVAGGVEVFDRAVQFAKQLAVEFDAQLVDDNRRVLSDVGLSRIRDQLVHIYSSMDDRGIAPAVLLHSGCLPDTLHTGRPMPAFFCLRSCNEHQRPCFPCQQTAPAAEPLRP
jgi:FtsZ-interacting cell division protein ZipA